MTDQNHFVQAAAEAVSMPTPVASTASQIDRLVAASTPIAIGPKVNSTPDMRSDHEGNVTIMTQAANPGYVGTAPGLDLGAEISGIEANIAHIEAELAEQTFDPTTGKATYVREGKERSDREAQLVSLKAAKDYQLLRNQQVQASRDAEAAAKAQADRERAARHAFSQGSPERAALFDKAIAEEEARAGAAAIVASRHG